MAQIITKIDVGLPPGLTSITKNNFLIYLAWQDESKELNKKIISKFKEGAFKTTPYDEENVPDDVDETPLKAGNLEFIITTTPTKKRPSYEEVNTKFEHYLNVILQQYKKGVRREGVLTINEEPYVLCKDLMDKISLYLRNSFRGKEGISQSLKLIKPEELLQQLPNIISIALERDYSKLTEPDGITFVETSNFLKTGNERTEPFKKEILLEDSLKIIGELNNVVAVSYQFDNMIFMHQLEPRTTPRYRDIIETLTKENPKKLTTRSKIGDLVLAELFARGEISLEVLKEKGLIDTKFLNDYDPIRREDNIYVRLNGIIKRLTHYKEFFVTGGIEQNISLKIKYGAD